MISEELDIYIQLKYGQSFLEHRRKAQARSADFSDAWCAVNFACCWVCTPIPELEYLMRDNPSYWKQYCAKFNLERT